MIIHHNPWIEKWSLKLSSQILVFSFYLIPIYKAYWNISKWNCFRYFAWSWTWLDEIANLSMTLGKMPKPFLYSANIPISQVSISQVGKRDS